MILISACLCGVNCKYNGENNLDIRIKKLLEIGKAILVCPEQLGGNCTPRPPHEIINGTGSDVLKQNAKIMTKEGIDSTEKFLKGAYETLKIAKEAKCNIAILKAKSPSCGCGKIYNGKFNGEKIKGNGVTAELLLQNGIKIYTEENFHEFLKLNDFNF